MLPQPEACDRAREYASRRLDGELSELEARLLVTHLTRCAACHEYESAISAGTAWLRSMPLESLAHPIEFPRRRILGATQRIGAVAAAAVVIVGSLQVVDGLRQRPHALEGRGPSVSNAERDFWNARRVTLAGRQLQPFLRRQVSALPD